MKKVILTIVTALFTVGMMSAQDLSSAVEAYNNGAEALAIGDKTKALDNFNRALSLAEACGAEGKDVVANCKNAIPGVILSIGKDLYNNKNFEEALAKISEAADIAMKYNNADVMKEASELIPQISIMKDMDAANAAFDAKDMKSAIAGYKKVIETDNTNAVAALRLVQCLTGIGDFEGAKEFVKIAAANGQGENANKVLGTALLKKAASSLKAGKYADAIAQASESTEYTKNAQAYLIAGQAATKLNDNNKAIEYFSKYLKLAPKAKNAGAIALTVGALYQGQKNNAKALEYYKIAQAAGVDTKAYIDALSK
ncbi:MAG: tetratricopeptide repeat protein [Candidatus Cryptobacteroides sp.]